MFLFYGFHILTEIKILKTFDAWLPLKMVLIIIDSKNKNI